MTKGSARIGRAVIAWESHGPEHAPVIVFSHSLGLDSSTWLPQIEALQGRFRLVTVDLPGHGGSAADPPYSLDQLAGNLLAAATDAGADRFHFCGISLSGQIALWTAINHPDRLQSVIASNTAARIGSSQSWADRIAVVRAGGLESIADSAMGRFFSPDFADRHADWLKAARQVFTACDADAYIGCCEVLAVTDLSDRVTDITVPCLVVGGTIDPSTTPEQARWLHDQIPGSTFTLLEGAAHISNLDRPDGFTEAVAGFIDRVEAAVS